MSLLPTGQGLTVVDQGYVTVTNRAGVGSSSSRICHDYQQGMTWQLLINDMLQGMSPNIKYALYADVIFL